MILNNKTKSANFDYSKKNRKLTIIILFIIVLIYFCFLTVYYFYLPYHEQIQEVYYNSIDIIITTILIVIRVSVLISLVYVLFKKWISHKEPHYSDIPFLLGLFFYIFIFGKLIDLVLYTTYAIIFFFGGFSELFSNLFKFRYIIATTNMLPIILIGIYFYFFRNSLGKRDFQIEKNARKNTSIFSVVFLSTSLITIFLLKDPNHFSLIAGVISLICFSFLIWGFITVHKGKILPEIHSLIISIGFTLLLIFNILFPIFMNLLRENSTTGDVFTALTIEGGTLIATIIILIGFKTKARY